MLTKERLTPKGAIQIAISLLFWRCLYPAALRFENNCAAFSSLARDFFSGGATFQKFKVDLVDCLLNEVRPKKRLRDISTLREHRAVAPRIITYFDINFKARHSEKKLNEIDEKIICFVLTEVELLYCHKILRGPR